MALTVAVAVVVAVVVTVDVVRVVMVGRCLVGRLVLATSVEIFSSARKKYPPMHTIVCRVGVG